MSFFTEHDFDVVRALYRLTPHTGASDFMIQGLIHNPEFQRSISKNCACALDGWIASCIANAEGGPFEPFEPYNIEDVPIKERLRLYRELFKELFAKEDTNNGNVNIEFDEKELDEILEYQKCINATTVQEAILNAIRSQSK